MLDLCDLVADAYCSEKSLPQLTWQIINPEQSPYGWIQANGEVMMLITDMPSFFNTLGYEHYFKGMIEDSFLFPDTPSSTSKNNDYAFCPQVLLAAYLHKYSEVFREKYGELFPDWVVNCLLNIDLERVPCARCYMAKTTIHGIMKSIRFT